MNSQADRQLTGDEPEVTRSGEDGAAQLRVFGNYEILAEIGRGGMGIVYRARDCSLDRVVALKLLREDLRRHAHLVTRFQREAQAVASLDHPNIVQIFSVGTVDDAPYFAMEYVDAEPLSAIMRRRRMLPWYEALQIGEHIAGALAAAHRAQIIHRDIKPPNILVNSQGQAFVTDFGIAKVLSAEQQLTVEGSRLGTPWYMAPERCGNGEVTASSDVYSLGVLMFQMISGRLPHEGADHTEVIKNILSQPPARLSRYVPDIPEDVERLVAFFIEGKPENRPESADEARDAIRRVRAGKPLDTRQNSAANALADFRQAVTPLQTPSPTPSTTPDTTQTHKERITHVTTQIRLGWRLLPKAARGTLGAIGLVLLCLLVAFASATLLERADAPPIVPKEDSALSSWKDDAAAASFVPETTGVLLAKPELADFAFASAAWLGGDSRLALAIVGRPGTPRAGQRAVCLMDPERKEASIIVAPIPSAHAGSARQGFDLLPSTGRPGHLMLILSGAYSSRAHEQTQKLVSLPIWAPDAPRVLYVSSGEADEISAAAISGDGATLAVALLSPERRHSRVVTRALENGVAGAEERLIADMQGRVISLQLTADSTRAVWLGEIDGGRRALYAASLQGPPGEPVLLAEGDVSMASAAMGTDERSVLAAVRAQQGQYSLQLLGVNDGQVIADLGPGLLGACAPGCRRMVAVAEDVAGRQQLWICNPDTRERTQLTFLDPGVTRFCGVSPDCRWAMAPLQDEANATIVFVNLADPGLRIP